MKKDSMKQCFINLKNLMLLFKWYIAAYMFVFSGSIHEYFFPPEANDPIWRAEAVHGLWHLSMVLLGVEDY